MPRPPAPRVRAWGSPDPYRPQPGPLSMVGSILLSLAIMGSGSTSTHRAWPSIFLVGVGLAFTPWRVIGLLGAHYCIAAGILAGSQRPGRPRARRAVHRLRRAVLVGRLQLPTASDSRFAMRWLVSTLRGSPEIAAERCRQFSAAGSTRVMLPNMRPRFHRFPSSGRAANPGSQDGHPFRALRSPAAVPLLTRSIGGKRRIATAPA